MKPVGIISTGVLLLLLGSVASTYAQQDQQQEAKSPKQVQQAKPEKQQQDRNKQQQDKNKQQQQRAQKQQQEQNKQQQHAQKQQQDQNRAATSTLRNSNRNRTSSSSTLRNSNGNRTSSNKTPRNSNRTRTTNSNSAPRNSNRTGTTSSNNTLRNNNRTRTSSSVSSWTIGLHSSGNVCSTISRERCGSSIAHVTGSPSTAIGGNVAVIPATAFQMPIIVAALARITGSASTGTRWSCMAGIRGSSTEAFGSVSWTHGQSTGRTIGTTTMMCMSFTPKTAITCTTAGTPGIGSQSPYMWTDGVIECAAIEIGQQRRLGKIRGTTTSLKSLDAT